MSTPAPLTIPREILLEVYREARASFPEECCGWLVGTRDGDGVSAVRRCDNVQSAGGHPIAADRGCLLYTSPSPRDGLLSRMPSSA